MPMAQNAAPTITDRRSDSLKTSSARSRSFWPAACDTSVVMPTPSICVMARTMNVRFPAIATPATASFPSRPTQYRSTRKYSV